MDTTNTVTRIDAFVIRTSFRLRAVRVKDTLGMTTKVRVSEVTR